MVSVTRGGWTRRAILAQFACARALLAQGGTPLRTLRDSHPRLLVLDSDLDRIRLLVRDSAPARKIYLDLERESDKLLNAPTVEYKLSGTRLSAQAARLLDRVYSLSLLYRIDNRRSALDRAVKELHAVAAFRDWNPGHFQDVAEITHAFAIAYDWLYPGLSPIERTWMKAAILGKGLEPGLQSFTTQAPWTTSRLSTNLVCNSGLALGALAIGDEEPEKSAALLKYTLDSMPKALASYGVDGGWVEGPGYWDFATRYATYFLAGLDSALGTDSNLMIQPGFPKAGRFRIYFSGPTNRTFNYADSTDELTEEPAMYWLARRFTQPVYAWQQQKLVERSSHPDPLDLVWFQREMKSPVAAQWPLDTVFSGVNCAFFRSAWEDPNGLYLAVKGGDNKASHAHLDLGSFVLDAGGVRWALDLGPDDINLPNYLGRLRWTYYRTRTEAHNTVLIDGENQDIRAEAKITKHDFGPDLSWVQIDLSKAYPTRVKLLQRRIGMASRQAVLIQDTLQADQPVEPLWGMMTDAEITVNGQTAELTKEGWTLSAEIRTPRHAVFDVVAAKAPPPQAQNAGVKKLVVRMSERVTDLDLNIVLAPHKTGTPKPKVAVKFPA
jgi:hypothetical protein